MSKNEVRWVLRLLKVTPKKLTAPASFNERLRLQKAVFLLRHLNVEPFRKYNFSLYLHGPYSSELAKDYYGLTKVKSKPVPVDTDKLNQLEWFVSKNEKWLEIASSILSLKERYEGVPKEAIYSTLTMSKPWVDRATYESVTKDLADNQLLPP